MRTMISRLLASAGWMGPRAEVRAGALRTPPRRGFEALEPRKLLATLTVTNLDDAGAGSLRQAILDANTIGGADVIEFQAGLAGTLELGSVLTIAGSTDIDGPGADLLTVTGVWPATAFNVLGGTSTISGLKIADWGLGAYVDAGAALTLDGVVISNPNPGVDPWSGSGGVTNAGTLTVRNSLLTGNGGSIMASSGGVAITSTGALTVENTTITGNAGSLTSAAVGVYNGTVLIRNSTIASNGGLTGVQIEGAAGTIISTIIAGHDTDLAPVDPLTSDSANNLIADASSAGGLTNGVNGNLVGVDPLLGSLADNGGTTMTMALPSGSPAIGNGSNPGGLTTDQRGGLFSRGTAVDIGAYQRQTFNLVVDTLVDEDDGNYGAGDLSLREALSIATNPGADAITFSAALNGGTIALGGSELVVDGDVAITGPGADQLAISGNNQSRVFYFTAGTHSLAGLKITGGAPTIPEAGVLSGGGIRNKGNLALDAVWITGNGVPGGGENGGGGIHNAAGGSLTVTNSTISGNAGGYWGGGILNTDGATLTITNSTITANSATFGASAINCSGATTIQNCTIAGNSTTPGGFGGEAVFVGSSTVMISTIVSGNTRDDDPAALAGTLLGTSTNNLIDSDQNAGGLVNGVNGNLVGVDPTLGALADNGGPTMTMALLPGSPAINKGSNPASLTTDQRGLPRTRGAAVDVGAFEFTAAPTIAGLQVGSGSAFSIEQAARGSMVVLYPGDQADADGSATTTNFYRDIDGDGIADTAELIGSTSDEFSLPYAIAADAPLGEMIFLAVAVDNDGLHSAPASASITIVPAAPTLASLTLSALVVRRGQPVVFTAHDPVGGETGVVVARVEFYRQVTNQGSTTAIKVGEDTTPTDGWTYTLDTSGMEPGFPSRIGPSGYLGHVTYYAVTVDTYGTSSEPAYAEGFEDLEILGQPMPGASASGTGVVNVTTGDRAGTPTIFRLQPGSGWTWSDLQAKTGCPDITGEVVTWVDPKDGLTYAAAMSAQGLLLFTNTSGAEWTFRNLGTEVAGTPAITGNLTTFTSTDGLVSIAGVATNGDLIRYTQTGDGDGVNHAWTAVNHGDELRSLGLTVPQFTGRITSFVTPWNALNVIGLDASGQIQAVWWHQSLATGGKWTTNNLSADTGAPALAGGLTVWITSWNAVNIAGTDAGGKISATWWVPGYNDNRWNNNNLTDDIGGPTFEASSVTSWVTPWGAMNITGREADGTLGVYWWVPGHNNNLWNIEHFRDIVPEATLTSGPVTGLTALGGDNSMSILSTAGSGDVMRLWWSPSTNAWAEENLTQTAVPA